MAACPCAMILSSSTAKVMSVSFSNTKTKLLTYIFNRNRWFLGQNSKQIIYAIIYAKIYAKIYAYYRKWK